MLVCWCVRECGKLKLKWEHASSAHLLEQHLGVNSVHNPFIVFNGSVKTHLDLIVAQTEGTVSALFNGPVLLPDDFILVNVKVDKFFLAELHSVQASVGIVGDAKCGLPVICLCVVESALLVDKGVVVIEQLLFVGELGFVNSVRFPAVCAAVPGFSRLCLNHGALNDWRSWCLGLFSLCLGIVLFLLLYLCILGVCSDFPLLLLFVRHFILPDIPQFFLGVAQQEFDLGPELLLGQDR